MLQQGSGVNPVLHSRMTRWPVIGVLIRLQGKLPLKKNIKEKPSACQGGYAKADALLTIEAGDRIIVREK